jgi:diguanylate cyclase (GGDEF)-like protein
MIDLDHFKAINDRHGHLLGDEVLRHVGTLLAQGFREPDFVARWGGEEFVALLHGVTPTQALAACERLRLAIAAHGWSAIEPTLAVTASIGVHAIAGGQALDEAIALADRALYAAKAGGRNRVVLGGVGQTGGV